MPRAIDHIVYAVFDLDHAIDRFERLLGVRPLFGGYHKTQGTKNALVNLDDGMYLELMAVDRSNTKIHAPRWMGVDVLSKPQITRWALKSNDLRKDGAIVKQYHPKMGEVVEGSRNTDKGSLLQWKLHMPLPMPEVEIVPFFIDWNGSKTHPSKEIPKMDCNLKALYATHPKPKLFESVWKDLQIELRVQESEYISMKAILDTPNGMITI